MTYKHGVFGSEVPTSIVPMTNVSAGLPVVFGTAPVHLASDFAGANKPVLCHTYNEAVAALGYSDDWGSYTLCEFMKSHFALFNMAPVVFVNVLDPGKTAHKEAVTDSDVTLTEGVGVIAEAVYLPTLVVKKTSAGQALVKGTDYTAEYDEAGKLVITALAGGQLVSASSCVASFDKLKPSGVDDDDIIGGVDISTGDSTGLELVHEIYPRFGLVPGIILAPGWSHLPEVAAVMKAKCENISGHFEAICICDLDTDTVTKYSDVKAWKDGNNYVAARQVLCWPKVKLGDAQYHMSTQLAGVICKTDAAHEDVPYWSPSNQSLQCDGVFAGAAGSEKEIFLNSENAQYLNGEGIVTALNFIGGWKAWGNRTTIYPSVTDPKDAFICIRRMFNWLNNTLITSFWQKIDNPANKRLIATIVDSANIWLNGLTSRGMLLGGRVEFREDENPVTDLMDGIIRFHVYFTPPAPARDIEFIQEYDPAYMATLFE